MVRIAQLEIHPQHLLQYKKLLEEEITNSIKKEPGVITLYAVAEKDRPNFVMIFETYQDEKAYQKHLKSAHFIKYKTLTEKMVKSLKLIPCLPISLGAK
ncbi:antibiotic biosynthesis monooxygenase [Pedobacter aquatilis]|uniref:putative quinol monooxygenase n=1 Tax=Pedobacter aquatilis TaxID=351343 RepID=UPI0025B54159|nr:antibiotic biosynthesis monooxygenase [Pedobacter aquatilis]MDN3587852.1 antibiotic biosynthesis monooxygenase [Pedobacter aquatilis]